MSHPLFSSDFCCTDSRDRTSGSGLRLRRSTTRLRLLCPQHLNRWEHKLFEKRFIRHAETRPTATTTAAAFQLLPPTEAARAYCGGEGVISVSQEFYFGAHSFSLSAELAQLGGGFVLVSLG
jgi:hypothetical protein